MRPAVGKYFIPAVLTLTISGLAITLIAVVIARSPYTHGNLRPAAGYTRTEVAYVGQDRPFEGIGLANPRLAETGDPAADGRSLFFGLGCSGCHGLTGRGGTIGPNITGTAASKLSRKVRSGPKGMPEYLPDTLSDEQIQQIAAFLAAMDDEQQ